MKRHKNYVLFFLIVLAGISIFSCDKANKGFDWSGKISIIIPSELYGDAAIMLAVTDFSDAVSRLYNAKTEVVSSCDLNWIPDNSVLLVASTDTKSWSKVSDVEVPRLADEGFIINSIHQDGKSLLVVSGRGTLGLAYGLFHLIEKIRINKATPIQDVNVKREPDMTFRMLTQPFEVTGYPEMASLEKPITQNLKREFDPMRPWEGKGYTPESEAKNILRAGLNTMWVGNLTYASLYGEYDPNIFPKGSKGREWVQERRKKIRELVDVAEKYHLKTVASTDVFAYPKSADPSKKWDLLAASLTRFLTDYPEIDRISTRFGENYSFFNPFFAGEGIKSEDQFAETIDFIHNIVAGQFGKTYMCRTWALGNDNWGADPENYLDVIKNIKADKDIIFSAKNTRTDYWRYNKFNPVIGTGDYPQAIEIACQDGYNFKNAIPYFEVARMANGPKEFGGGQGLKWAYKEGVRTVWGWLSADGWCGPYIKREEWLKANIFGFSHLTWDVDKDSKTIAREWAAIEFGVDISDEVVGNIADILLLSEDLILKTRYFRSYGLQHEGWKPSNNWIRDNLIGGGEFSYNDPTCDNSPKPGHLKPIFNPATIEADITEKLQAKRIVDEMLSKYEAIKDRIPDQDKAEEVHHTLLYAKYLIYSLVHYVNGMFRYYNGEFEKAINNLKEWKKNWTVYTEKIPGLKGSASLMLDGGMVRTVEEAMTDMGHPFDDR